MLIIQPTVKKWEKREGKKDNIGGGGGGGTWKNDELDQKGAMALRAEGFCDCKIYCCFWEWDYEEI